MSEEQGQAERPVLGLGNVGLCLTVSRDGRALELAQGLF